MPTEVLTIDNLCEKLRNLQEDMRADGDEPVVLIGDIMGQFDVATPLDPNYSNMRIGDAGFSPAVFANAADNSVLTGAKDALLHSIIVTEDDLSEEGRDLLPDDEDEEIVPDGGVVFTDLHAFKRDTLYAIRQLEQDGSPKGTAIMRALEAKYDEQLNHSRLYQNLDDLVDLGLVEKGKKDDRTNEYTTTAEGRRLLEREAARRAETVGLDTDVSVQQEMNEPSSTECSRLQCTNKATTTVEFGPNDEKPVCDDCEKHFKEMNPEEESA